MFKTKLLSPHVLEVEIPYNSKNNQFSFLLSSDHHWDNPKCELNLLKRHHEQAVEKEAGIFCFGDLFCVMQGKADKRGTKADIRPEHMGVNYFDKVVKTAAKWYSRYKDNYIVITPGNHETAVLKYQETDLIERLCDRLKIKNMPYSGYIRFKFIHSSGGAVKTIVLKYHHGYGGGGPVTRNTIQSNRQAVYLPDADIVVQGHVHERWSLEVMRERLLQNGTTVIKPQTHVQLSTYKEEYLNHNGFHIEKGRGPKPLGGYWLNFDLTGQKLNYNLQVTDTV